MAAPPGAAAARAVRRVRVVVVAARDAGVAPSPILRAAAGAALGTALMAATGGAAAGPDRTSILAVGALAIEAIISPPIGAVDRPGSG